MENREELIRRLELLEADPRMQTDYLFRSEVETLRKDLGLDDAADEINSLKEEVANLKNELEDIKIDRLYDNIEDNSNDDVTDEELNTLLYENPTDDEEYEEEEGKSSILSTILLSLLGILLIGGLVFGVYKLFFAEKNARNKELTEVFNSSELFLHKNYENGIEYGEGEIPSKQLLDLVKYGELVVTANPEIIDTNKVGTQTIEYTISKGKDTKKLTKEFEVVDSVLPEISGVRESLELVPNSEFDLDDFIKNLKVSDSIDGEFEKVEEEPTRNADGGYDKGWYTVKNNINLKEESTYNITIHAVDKNGNEQDLVIPVKVSSKTSSTADTSSTNNTASNTGRQNSQTTTQTTKRKCEYKVVDQTALEEISQQVKVVDKPAQKRIVEKVWVETAPGTPAVTKEIYVIDVPADPERGIEEKGHTETVIVTPAIPAQGYYEEKVIQEAQEEVWHYEKQILQEARAEKSHIEVRDCE